MSDDCELPLLLNATAIARILHKPVQSVHRWSSVGATAGSRLPVPDVNTPGAPLWTEDTILAYAERRKLPVDYVLLEDYRVSVSGHD